MSRDHSRRVTDARCNGAPGEGHRPSRRRSRIPEYATATALLLALLPWPYGYFVLLRWVMAGLASFLSWEEWKQGSVGWTWLWGVVALLFNPVLPISLGRPIWLLVDCVAAFLLLRYVKVSD